MDDLIEIIKSMAEQFAEEQEKALIAGVEKAADEVGNNVFAARIGDKEAFLEMRRRLQTDFDPETLKPKDLRLVFHPSQVESVMKQMEEWHKDPDFLAELEKIRLVKIEEWRARENRRKLVD